MVVEVTAQGDKIVFTVKGWHKLWALRSRLVVPRSHILAARRDPAAARGRKGWRCPGTHIPGILTAGTFYLDGQRIFRDVRNAEKVVAVDLVNASYQRLIIEVENPDAVVALLAPAS